MVDWLNTVPIADDSIQIEETKLMIDYVESKMARREYEERVRSLVPVEDYDAWLNGTAGHWQALSVGRLLSSLGTRIAAVRYRLKHSRQAQPDGTFSVQERRSAPG
jgi:hypothetical protein